MEKRVYGLETEYGIVASENQPNCFVFDAIDAFLRLISWRNEPRRGAGESNFFYVNGSRIYRDLGHPEYATPECASIRDLIIWDKAGERIFEKAMAEANKFFLENGRPGDAISLFKNNCDASDATFGCHENYLVSRLTDCEYLKKYLIPFLVTRQIFCGAGSLEADGFKISQRSRHIVSEADGSTTQKRPIVNLRDEALADSAKWRRLHLILGDANMSEVSGFLKMGTTALVLKMIEDRFITGEGIVLFDPVSALKEISVDLDGREEIRLFRPLTPNGSFYISAVEIQEIYLNWAKEYLAGISCVEPEWLEIIGRWENVLDCLKDDPMKLFREVDWVAKKWLMESVLDKHGRGWDDLRGAIAVLENETLFETLKTIDLQYHDIRRDAGIYNLMEKEGLMEKLVREEEIALAETEPPQDTRAKWRCSFFDLARDERLKSFRFSISNWDRVVVNVPTGFFGFGSSLPENGSKTGIFLFYFDNNDPLDNRVLKPEELLGKIGLPF